MIKLNLKKNMFADPKWQNWKAHIGFPDRELAPVCLKRSDVT